VPSKRRTPDGADMQHNSASPELYSVPLRVRKTQIKRSNVCGFLLCKFLHFTFGDKSAIGTGILASSKTIIKSNLYYCFQKTQNFLGTDILVMQKHM
jgi:hypothetical protein